MTGVQTCALPISLTSSFFLLFLKSNTVSLPLVSFLFRICANKISFSFRDYQMPYKSSFTPFHQLFLSTFNLLSHKLVHHVVPQRSIHCHSHNLSLYRIHSPSPQPPSYGCSNICTVEISFRYREKVLCCSPFYRLNQKCPLLVAPALRIVSVLSLERETNQFLV